MNALISRLGSFVLWWLVLFGLWLIYVGTTEHLEVIGGICAALLGALLAEAVRAQGLLRFAVEPAWLAKAWRAPFDILFDFAVVTWALVLHVARVRPVRSAYEAVPFPARGADARAAGRRAFATIAGTISPNTIVVDLDRERNVALKHDLVPKRASKRIP